jgi:hypothetical protein
MTINLDTLERIARAATPDPLTVIRYEHGGGRIFLEEPRTLVADFFNEGDREFYAAASPSTVLEMVAELRALRAVCAVLDAEFVTVRRRLESGFYAFPEHLSNIITAYDAARAALPPAPVKQGEATP